MRILRVFVMYLFSALIIASVFFTCYCYDPVRDYFVISENTIIDLDGWVIGIDNNKDEYLNISSNVEEISFSNLFNIRYKLYRIVGYFCVCALYASFVFIYLIQSKWCKKSFIETFREKEDRIIFYMSSVLFGLIFLFINIYIYNSYFINHNLVSELQYKSQVDTNIMEVMK